MRLSRRCSIGTEILWLPTAVINKMVTEADAWAPDETGGALIGYEIDEGLVVTKVVGAGPNAVRTKSDFQPDGEYQLGEIARLYEESGRTHTFVGDWHSHPRSSPAFSPKDRSAMRTVAQAADSRCERPLMLILGESDPWRAVAWRYRRGRIWDKVEAMQIVEF